MIEKLRQQCEAALISGVLVTKENMFPVINESAAHFNILMHIFVSACQGGNGIFMLLPPGRDDSGKMCQVSQN